MATINAVGLSLSGISGPNSFVYNDATGKMTGGGKSGFGYTNSFAVTDSNGILSNIFNVVPYCSDRNVAAGNVALTLPAAQTQRFIGNGSAITCTLPSSGTMTNGQTFLIINSSTVNIEVRTFTNNTLTTLTPGTYINVQLVDRGSFNASAYFTISRTIPAGVVLSPSAAQTITSQNLTLQTGSMFATIGSFNSGSAAGGFSGQFRAFATTASLGSLSLTAANNSGNFANVLTNASTTAAQTYTLPDASGTILLDTTIGINYVSLAPTANQTITNGFSLINSLGAFVSGDAAAGGFAGQFTAYSPTAGLGSLQLAASDSAGAYIGTLTNASLATTNQTWTLPDVSGTILLDGTAVSLNPTADQTINGAFNLTNSQGGFFAPFNYFTSGSAAGGLGGAFKAFPFTAAAGLLQLAAADSSGDFVGTLTNASMSADRSWSLPDQSGTLTVLGNGVTGTGNIVLDTAPTVSSIAFSPTTQGIVGTTAGDDAAASYVGEYIESVVTTPAALTPLTSVDITSISLSAGDWDVYSNVAFTSDTGCNIVYLSNWTSDVSATEPSQEYLAKVAYSGAGIVTGQAESGSLTSPFRRFSLSTTTTIYLTAKCRYSIAALSASGVICARRVR